jgi:hypothetical protein
MKNTKPDNNERKFIDVLSSLPALRSLSCDLQRARVSTAPGRPRPGARLYKAGESVSTTLTVAQVQARIRWELWELRISPKDAIKLYTK